MLTNRVPTGESMTTDDQNVLSIALVVQVLVRRFGGEVTIPVKELMEMVSERAQWDRVGDNIVIRIGELCHR